jgi:hypothetical protein
MLMRDRSSSLFPAKTTVRRMRRPARGSGRPRRASIPVGDPTSERIFGLHYGHNGQGNSMFEVSVGSGVSSVGPARHSSSGTRMIAIGLSAVNR